MQSYGTKSGAYCKFCQFKTKLWKETKKYLQVKTEKLVLNLEKNEKHSQTMKKCMKIFSIQV